MHQAQGDRSEAFGVLPENWEAALAFFACARQWHKDSRGSIDGLRYEALELVMKHQKVTDPDDTFSRAQVMEGAAIDQARRMTPKN